jgi:hypothetical protein
VRMVTGSFGGARLCHRYQAFMMKFIVLIVSVLTFFYLDYTS